MFQQLPLKCHLRATRDFIVRVKSSWFVSSATKQNTTPLKYILFIPCLEAYTNNWGLFGKENYLAFDW